MTKYSSWSRCALPGLVFDGELGLGSGGVGDEDVDRAEVAGDFGDQAGDLLFVADVGGEGVGLAAGGADFGADLLGFPRRLEVVDGYVGTGLGERCGHGGAQAAGGSGNECGVHGATLPVRDCAGTWLVLR